MSISGLIAVPVGAPLVAAAVALVSRRRSLSGWSGIAASLAVLAAGIAIAARVGSGHVVADAHLLRADAAAAVMVIVIGAVGALATFAGVGYLDAELADGATTPAAARQYEVLVQVFLAAMSLAVLADNLGVVWVAVEATTIATAFLVGHRRTRQSLEATWKYVVICSLGITLAFFGVVILYFASIHAGASPTSALDLDVLASRASHLDPAVTRLAVGLMLVGFGTKAGLVPFHTWLADAHSQAPAPVSALMSGVLLSVAFSVVLRVRALADSALGPGFARDWLLVTGLATLLVAVSLLVAQRDLKRLLAYSSLEQMGLIAVAAAAGTRLAIAGLLLVVTAHGVVKAVLFISAGELQHVHGSSSIADLTGIAARSPLLGAAIGAGLLGLVGLPPFALFGGELAIARGMADAHLAPALGVALVLLVVGYASIVNHGAAMLLGPARAGSPAIVVSRPVAVPVVLGVAVLVVLGVVGGPYPHLLETAATVLGAR
ncbi:MAG TPA: proton-conducting transporter membrane subunit [Acidimicrobiales bacterium]|nr:proton-conducting transporter membrane subunit [Acidimicrobiales bacterium]